MAFCGTGNYDRRPRATVRSGIIQRFTLSTVVVVTTKFHYISSVNDDNGKNLDTVFWGLGLAEIVLRLFLFWYMCSQSQSQVHRFHNFTSSIYSTVSLIHTYIHYSRRWIIIIPTHDKREHSSRELFLHIGYPLRDTDYVADGFKNTRCVYN